MWLFIRLLLGLASIHSITYDGEIILLLSLTLVFGCFCIVSSWPSKAFKYWICCGDGTGIRFGSLPNNKKPLKMNI